MAWFTFAVVGLRETDKPLALAVESLRVTLLLAAEFIQFGFGHASLVHRPLPAGVPPAPKVFVDTLAFRSVQACHGNDSPRTESIAVMVQRNQCVTADGGPCHDPVEEPA